MTSIPIVWRRDGNSPPEWVLFEMQGELQYKGVEKKIAGTTSSNVTIFEGAQMGILSPSNEHVNETQSIRRDYSCTRIIIPHQSPQLAQSAL